MAKDDVAITKCGTPGYCAPEVLMGQGYNKECDYWSVGVVAFILLSGASPFDTEGSILNEFVIFDKTKKCDYNFDVDTWKTISK